MDDEIDKFHGAHKFTTQKAPPLEEQVEMYKDLYESIERRVSELGLRVMELERQDKLKDGIIEELERQVLLRFMGTVS